MIRTRVTTRESANFMVDDKWSYSKSDAIVEEILENWLRFEKENCCRSRLDNDIEAT